MQYFWGQSVWVIGWGLTVVLGNATASNALPGLSASGLSMLDSGNRSTDPAFFALSSPSESHPDFYLSDDLNPSSPMDPSVLLAQTPPEAFDLSPDLVEDSPVLQQWLEEVPDVRSEIRNDPSFRTRLRWGYSQFPSTDQASGFHVGIEDVFIERTGLTISADYQTAFDADREAYGADLRYYLLPLGGYINLAPVVGYRWVEGEEYTTDGANLGVRLLLVPSRTGAVDLSLMQTWVAPGTDEEVGVATLSVGYALTNQLRVAADLQKQNAPQSKDSRVGIGLEWMF